MRVGTLIGVNAEGFFGSKRECSWPDQPDAFSEPLITIPSVQILDYLRSEPAYAEIEGPEWIQRESVVLLFSELRPSTIAEIVDCLAEPPAISVLSAIEGLDVVARGLLRLRLTAVNDFRMNNSPTPNL